MQHYCADCSDGVATSIYTQREDGVDKALSFCSDTKSLLRRDITFAKKNRTASNALIKKIENVYEKRFCCKK